MPVPAVPAERVVAATAVLVATAGLLTVGYRVGDAPRSAREAAVEVSPTPTESPSPSPSPTRTMPPVFVSLPEWDSFHDTLVISRDGRRWRHDLGLTPSALTGIPTSPQAWLRVEGGNVVHARPNELDLEGTLTWVPIGGNGVALPGKADEVLPAADGRDVWLVSYDTSTGVQRGTARLADPRTGTVRRRVELPPSTEVAGAARDGLVLNVINPARSAMVWSPDSRKQVRSLDGYVTHVFGPRAVVLVEGGECAPRCHYVVETATGKRTRVKGLDDVYGPPVLSPDGRWLVNFVKYGESLVELRAVNVETGNAYVAPRMTRSTEFEIQWSRDARTMYVSLKHGEQWQVVAWRPGTWDIGTITEEAGGPALPE